MVQACAQTAGAATQAVHHLAKQAAGVASIRWEQSGFRTSTERGRIQTFRNVLGFKDGTANSAPGTRDFDSTVWVNGADQPKWLHNGSFLCVRRIRTNTAAWNHLSVPDQQVAIGRTKKGGVPLSGGTEFTPLRLDKVGEDGLPSIPLDSHVRLASDTDNKGATMFRRGYSYDNGSAAPDGERDEGLLFLAYVRDIERQFVTIQSRLAAHDRLNAFLSPIGSAVFVVPPGSARDQWIGQSLLSRA